jgi:hypothetical protein
VQPQSFAVTPSPAVEQSETLDSEESPPNDPLNYLYDLAVQSRTVADGHLRRSNVHLLGGVLVGLTGLIFFFVMSKAVQLPSYDNNRAVTAAPAKPAVAPSPLVALKPTSTVWDYVLLNVAISIPRVAILIFIELMAGFFLRQYRVAMEEYRYFETIQRQRENVLAVYLMDRTRPTVTAFDVLSARLFADAPVGVLKAGETTAVLETQKQDNEFKVAVDQLSSLAGQIKSKVGTAT